MRGFCAFLLVVLGCGLCCAYTGFNAAYLKHVDANITCGSPSEEYFKTQQGDILDPRKRIPYVCNASDPALAHPPAKMIDASLATYWQSTAREDVAFIVIDMKQVLRLCKYKCHSERQSARPFIFIASFLALLKLDEFGSID